MPPISENILRRLQLPVIRRLEGLLQGDYRSPARGDGLDLADLREYQFHDDVRRIDWNATARMDAPLCAIIWKTARFPSGSCWT